MQNSEEETKGKNKKVDSRRLRKTPTPQNSELHLGLPNTQFFQHTYEISDYL